MLKLEGHGPCWLDIPVNIQGAYIDTDNLIEFDINECDITPKKVENDIINQVIKKVKSSKRPILYAGNGIRISGAYDEFKKLVEKLNIPVVTAWNSIDAIYDEHPLYVGRGGIMGDRAGNFAVQNSDLVLSIGCRLSIRQVGYNWQTWAREAYLIDVDVDENELKKPTLHMDLPICADAKDFIVQMNNSINEKIFDNIEWLQKCENWKKKYPVVLDKHYEICEDKANVYCFIKELSNLLKESQITVVGNGSACVVGSHAYTIKKDQRFIINSAIASMGYDLPAAIGACVADSSQDIILVTGDGSIQMNIQELQTIIHNKFPIKIFVINNAGYHSIRQTQSRFFNGNVVGIGPESNDLSFPDMQKIANAYGYPYYKINSNKSIKENIEKVLECEGPAICEIFVTTDQVFEPKSATKKLEDGSLVSAPLEDLAPFLPKDELRENMIIPLVGE